MAKPEGADVWLADLRDEGWTSARLASVLTEADRDLAARFHASEAQRLALASRVVMRTVLARYVGVEAASGPLVRGARGKPALAHVPGCAFNLSHTAGFGAVAVAAGPVGVDLEQERPLRDLDALIDRCCTPAERATLRGLSPEARHGAFFRCWTRKEAVAKAHGGGLSLPFDGLEVLPMEQGPVRVAVPASSDMWTVVDVDGPPGFSAAVAAAWPGSPVTTGWWTPADAASMAGGPGRAA